MCKVTPQTVSEGFTLSEPYCCHIVAPLDHTAAGG